MDQFVESMFCMLESTKNDVKMSLKSYIDYTVDTKFEAAKNFVVSYALVAQQMPRMPNSGDALALSQGLNNNHNVAALNSSAPANDNFASADQSGTENMLTTPGQQEQPQQLPTNESDDRDDVDFNQNSNDSLNGTGNDSPMENEQNLIEPHQSGGKIIEQSISASTSGQVRLSKRKPKKKVKFAESLIDNKAPKKAIRKGGAKRKTTESEKSAKKVNPEIQKNSQGFSGVRIPSYQCTWEDCGNYYHYNGDIIRHIRTKHFQLPKTKSAQMEQNIIDERNPNDYVRLVTASV